MYYALSNKERQTQMEELRRRAVRTPNPYQGIKAVEALAEYGEEAIPQLLMVSDITSLADTHVKQAANSEIDKIKKGLER
jgi:hypothetical protein